MTRRAHLPQLPAAFVPAPATGHPAGGLSRAAQNRVTTGHLGGRPAHLKFFHGDAAPRFHAERSGLRWARSRGVPVPDELGSGTTGCLECPESGAYLVLAHVGDDSLSDRLVAGRATDRLTASVSDALGRLLTAPVPSRPAPDYVAQRLRSLVTRYTPVLVRELDVPALLVRRFVDRATRRPWDRPTIPISFDWRARHVRTEGESLAALVDYEYFAWGDPVLEAANFLHDLRLHGRGPEGFENLVPASGESSELVRIYMARQALSHAAIRHSAGDAPTWPIEQELALAKEYVDDVLS